MNCFAERRIRKRARNVLHAARHARRMREDVAPASLIAPLSEAAEKVREALRARDVDGAGRAMDLVANSTERLEEAVRKVYPPRSFPGIRENVEVLLVAIAVAMAFRTYFLQPFKIPTGSMQPTLYGIEVLPDANPGTMDRPGLRQLKMALLGERYMEIRAKESGVIRKIGTVQDPCREFHRSPIMWFVHWLIGTYPPGPADVYGIGWMSEDKRALRVWCYQVINPKMKLHFEPDSEVTKGQLLATARIISGDHIFVDRLRWNFCRPKRGQVMVFSTKGISGLPPGTHYIKRMVGLPNEDIRIEPPYLQVKGKRVTEPECINRIQLKKSPYREGYQLTHTKGARLAEEGDVMPLGPAQYAGFGDNTGNSLDSRYWGSIPEKNLVGPALFVYWPFSRRWGSVD